MSEIEIPPPHSSTMNPHFPMNIIFLTITTREATVVGPHLVLIREKETQLGKKSRVFGSLHLKTFSPTVPIERILKLE